MWNAIRRLLTVNPMGVFIYTLMSKWYLMIAITSLVVTFWVFKGLDKAGVLKAAEEVISQALSDTKSVAKFCVPKITDIKAFWDCLQHPPEYSPDAGESDLQNKLDVLISKDPNKMQEPIINDPYYDNGKN